MPHELAAYITQYGYLAIFGLVFLQEIGVPNPVPNELVLIFAGYLASINLLSFPLAIMTAVAADFLGTSLLYAIFYTFGHTIIKKKPKWFPINKERLDRLGRLISRDWWGIYLGRLIPYVRGYASVAAGLLQLSPRTFLPMVFFSALTWSGGYVVLGKLLGPRWEQTLEQLGGTTRAIYIGIGALLVLLVGIQLYKYFKKRKLPQQ